ncbi:MAG: thymidine phosphorylase [Thiotrichales bacterium]|jgi:thymidine phosphorylase|nr:thymidine phosphorylase [Thiotrichales bacterium]MBT4654019.1 thymidine phosphorylase [Thiotrichales bacterium]MBT5499545.1 thymidine phosphorylase [Thiotrichales bacterium]MBT5984636.1 thymidine phosphorylase [Thiotrichales bacterium]MBT6771175.1 thymidine phosphorylase [Thiotrichales bacterium]
MSELFLPQELIRKKRDGASLNDAEIGFLVQGISDGSLTDAQLGAFAMAVFKCGMSMNERVDLTRHMMNSGDTLQWSQLELDGPVVDKHSTGGVGDKISLMLAPIVAACGGYVPMISGRGLGHTGGTLDKLESIPGYDGTPNNSKFQSLVKKVGCAIIGQTANLAPADQRFYATRDVTATVESIDLITASILSKKLASGLDALVMDIKTGNGAFAADYKMAQELAQSIANVSNQSGVPTSCLITDMNQVLGHSVGNATEVIECLDFLVNPKDASTRLITLTIELSAYMLQLSGLEKDLDIARKKSQDALNSGQAASIFGKMIYELGGPIDLLEKPNKHLNPMPIISPVKSKASGYISEIDVRAVGLSMIHLKAGRTRSTDPIDHGVGLSEIVSVGQWVSKGDTLAMAHCRDKDQISYLEKTLPSLITLNDNQITSPVLIHEVLSSNNGVSS